MTTGHRHPGVQPAHDRALAVEASARRYNGLFDRRRQVPSPKRAPVDEIQRVLALYRDRYQGLKVRHFHQLARRQHDVRFCYAFVRKALQTAAWSPNIGPELRDGVKVSPRS